MERTGDGGRGACGCRRREVLALAVGGLVLASGRPAAAESDNGLGGFVEEAHRMKREAVAAGDQPYGAVVVLDRAIVGYGPSRVVVDGDPDAHAERVAIRDAQRRLGRGSLAGAVLVSTSHPCPACEAAAARAGIERMRHGPDGTDAGRPHAR